MSTVIDPKSLYHSSRPWTRWWWFSGPISEPDIRYQLDWLRENGFGGVEIAWVYPLPGSQPGPEFLSPEWTKIVTFAKDYCDLIGIGCDFTFGTMWPFGGSFVEEKDASRTYRGLSQQRLKFTWENALSRKPAYIIDHLNRDALTRYAGAVGNALKPALEPGRSGLFCDSWEVETEGLWTDGLNELFAGEYGYSLIEHMEEIDLHPHVRYDYRKLIAKLILENFYRPFTTICHHLGGFSRVQCHGSPSDLLATYGAVDVPETEAILFEPYFARIAASASALSGKPVVSSETFTCLYGWKPRPGPAPYIGKEQVADMKLLVDALFANGVNQVFWHGMPFNPRNGKNEFYATVHMNPDAVFADEIAPFNLYMRKVSNFMRKGRTYTDIAVYLPLEDSWMENGLPEGDWSPDAKYVWEQRYLKMTDELHGRHPLWISGHYLKNAVFENGRLRIGGAEFSLLYIDVKWLDEKVLDNIVWLVTQGLIVVLKTQPSRPGNIGTRSYNAKLTILNNSGNVFHDLSAARIHCGTETVPLPPPLVTCPKPDAENAEENGNSVQSPLPSQLRFWCRIDDDRYYFFFAHPKSSEVTYPMEYGQSYMTETIAVSIAVNIHGREILLNLVFKPYQSILVEVSESGETIFHDIDFIPSTPRHA